jgi:hypothetical protein
MQHYVFNELMGRQEKKNVNLSMPPPVKMEWDQIVRRWGGPGSKRIWAVATACVLHFLELPENDQDSRIQHVIGADAREGQIDEMIEEAHEIAAHDPLRKRKAAMNLPHK